MNKQNIEIAKSYSAMSLLQNGVKKLPTIVEPIFPSTGVCAVAGSSDTGKSSFLRQLAISVAIGEKEFLGFKTNYVHRRVLYVATEDDENAISFLLTKVNGVLNRKSEDYKGLEYIFETEDLLINLELKLENQKVDVIIIDAFSDIYEGSMNESSKVRKFLNQYSQLAQKYKCLIIFLHHTGKSTDKLAPSKHNLLGSQGFEAKMRLVIELRLDKHDSSLRHLCIVKGNYLDQSYKNQSFVLKFDENLMFSSTENRVPFDKLNTKYNSDEKEKVKRLKQSGKTQKEIASILKISQSTVSRYLKK